MLPLCGQTHAEHSHHQLLAGGKVILDLHSAARQEGRSARGAPSGAQQDGPMPCHIAPGPEGSPGHIGSLPCHALLSTHRQQRAAQRGKAQHSAAHLHGQLLQLISALGQGEVVVGVAALVHEGHKAVVGDVQQSVLSAVHVGHLLDG